MLAWARGARNMTKRLEGKTALITGASSGIGKAVAVRFAQEGASVAINYRSGQAGAEATAADCRAVADDSSVFTTVYADVAKEADVEAMFEHVDREHAPLDILVNNAGIQMESPSDQLEAAAFDRVLGVNLRGAFLCARGAIQRFLKSGTGVVINDSSVHEIIPKPGYLAYSVSKGGMQNLTRTLALEYAARNIRVNAVAPGAIETPINDAWLNDVQARASVESHIPMGRPGTPEEMGAVFAFLASDDASYITGQTLFACGGLTIYPEYRENWAS